MRALLGAAPTRLRELLIGTPILRTSAPDALSR